MRKQMNDGIRERIILESIKLFSEKGYHGTSMRDIAQDAKCSLPMLYYYFENKQVLYTAITHDEFLLMHEKLNHSLPFTGSLPEFYKAFLESRRNLPSKEKALYRLALKTLYSFEDLPELTAQMQQWENERELFNKKLIAKYYGDTARVAAIASLLYRTVENITVKMIMQNTDITQETITREIDVIFDMITVNER